MGFKLFTLCTHAKSGEPVYARQARKFAYVHLKWEHYKGKDLPMYSLEFVGEPELGRFPVVYNSAHQGYIVFDGMIVDDLVEEAE